jgi:hypothetical protein
MNSKDKQYSHVIQFITYQVSVKYRGPLNTHPSFSKAESLFNDYPPKIEVKPIEGIDLNQVTYQYFDGVDLYNMQG